MLDLLVWMYLASGFLGYALALGTMTRMWPEQSHLLDAVIIGASGWTGFIGLLWIDHGRSWRLLPLGREQRLLARSLNHLCGSQPADARFRP